MKKLIFVLLFIVTTIHSQDLYSSSKTVEALNRDISQITPTIDPRKVPGASPQTYLSRQSCLGHYGPISAYGPLGLLGPIGDGFWKPSYWISGIGSWSKWSKELMNLDGPLSEEGPLGPNGPVSHVYYDGELFKVNDFAVQLRGNGLWTVLGPIGPLGPLGALGPLGPLGAHGFTKDDDGQYIDDHGTVQRRVEVAYEGSFRSYNLFENYTEEFAENVTNDTSFMVDGRISPGSEEDLYQFTTSDEEFVTIVLVPEKQLDDFDLTVLDEQGQVIAKADTQNFIDWVQLKVPAGRTLQVKVNLYSSYHWLSKTYRLFVVGSTKYLNHSEISGPHMVSWYTQPTETPEIQGMARQVRRSIRPRVLAYESFQEDISHWEQLSGDWKCHKANGEFYLENSNEEFAKIKSPVLKNKDWKNVRVKVTYSSENASSRVLILQNGQETVVADLKKTKKTELEIPLASILNKEPFSLQIETQEQGLKVYHLEFVGITHSSKK